MSQLPPKPALDRVIAEATKGAAASGSEPPTGQAPGRGLPPVHLWHPTHVGAIDIVIRRDGRWIHEGAEITRESLVRLFSTILRKDADGFCLVTPVEKLHIEVEDAPFLAVRLDAADGRLTFTTNVGDEVEAGPDHAIRVATGEDGEPRPYVHVRNGLEALITRSVFYELVELAETRRDADADVMAVRSGDAWFPIGPADAEEAVRA